MYKVIHHLPHLPLPLVIFVLIANVIAPAALAAGPDYQVDVIDLNPEQGADFNPVPANGTYRQGLVYFQASTDDGNEVYVSDGTASGTRQLLDLMPGPDGSDPAELTRVGPAENPNSRVFFVADTQANGRELWVTGGTEASTLLVADFISGAADGNPDSLTAWGGQLYLGADAGAGRYLYQIDRATLGVNVLGSNEFELTMDTELVTTSSALYFAATSQATGQIEIWSTDGADVTQVTTAGCESIDDLHAAGGDFVFMVCNRAGSIELLEVDETQPNGTTLIQSHVGADSITELSNAGGVLYWVLDGDQLWGYDQSLPLVGIVATYGVGGNISGLTRLGTRVLFVANSGDGLEPHVAEGFASSQLSDVFPGAQGSMIFSILVPQDGWVYFMANDGVHGHELWRTDGTTAGTALFADIEPGAASSFPLNLLSSPLGLFFSENGTGLWATDGVAVNRIDNLQKSSSIPVELLHDPIASRLFMTISSEGFGTEPWISDGTDAGSFLLRDIRTGAASSLTDELFVTLPDPTGSTQDSGLIFAADDGISGTQLWRSEGTSVGTEALAIINPFGSSKIRPGVELGEHYYFAGDDGSIGLELWRTDGTTSGTEPYADINPTGGSISDSSPEFVVFDGRMFFAADDDVSGRELWSTDGITPPAMLADLSPGSDSSMPGELTVTASRLYFVAEDGNDKFLWRSDGTQAGTEPVLASGTSSLISVGDGVYFRHDDGNSGVELWRADADSVALALDLTPGPDSSTIRYVGVIDGKLIFHSLGTELWAIDSDTGQASLIGIFEDIDTNSTDKGERLGEQLYFRARLAGDGDELWRTDGVNLEMIDLEPGPGPSNPGELVAGNDRLWFFAYDSTVKNELHILSLLPAIGFAPNPVQFGDVELGSTAFATVSVSNTGGATLEPAAASIGGANPADFSILVDNCSGAQLAAGESCSIQLEFSPSTPGLRKAMVFMPSNIPGAAAKLFLRGSSNVIFADGFESDQQ